MILFGLYTGQRLSDLATLTWANIDLAREEVSIRTRKTDRYVNLPLAKPLVKHLESLPASDDPTAPLFPKVFATRERNDYSGSLSNQFYAILVAAGLAPKRNHKTTGTGRSVRRNLKSMSFHCLRHTATSLLKNAGASDVIARDIIGHDSVSVSKLYTHISTDAKRKAIEAMENVLEEAANEP